MTDEERGGDAAVEDASENEGAVAEGGDVVQAPGEDQPVDAGPEEHESTGNDAAENAGVESAAPEAETT